MRVSEFIDTEIFIKGRTGGEKFFRGMSVASRRFRIRRIRWESRAERDHQEKRGKGVRRASADHLQKRGRGSTCTRACIPTSISHCIFRDATVRPLCVTERFTSMHVFTALQPILEEVRHPKQRTRLFALPFWTSPILRVGAWTAREFSLVLPFVCVLHSNDNSLNASKQPG